MSFPCLVSPLQSSKDYLVNSLRQAVMELGVKVEAKIAEMNQQERLAFLAMEQEGWKGLSSGELTDRYTKSLCKIIDEKEKHG